jgi:hypothetical protein
MGIGAEVLRIVEEFEPILEPQDVPIPFMFRRRPWAQFNAVPDPGARETPCKPSDGGGEGGCSLPTPGDPVSIPHDAKIEG